MIDNKIIELINEKTDIVSLVSEFVSLEKVGKNYRGLCPFHNEKTPSFSVSPEKNIAKCMGCGEGGNPINFYRKIKNISFNDAVIELGEKVGIEVNASVKKRIDPNDKYYKIFDDAVFFYKYVLNNSEIGKKALEYLAKREINEDTINHFQIGVSPSNKEALYNFLKDKGHKVSDMIDLGLVKQNENGDYYDLFTSRLMFPITNPEGKIVGFSGRALDKKEEIKYINSPETVIFKKGLLLYNLFESTSEVRRNKQIILVEGFFDCISLYRIGIKNVVASMGTALTNDQVKLISKVTDRVVIAYDGDSAGQKATVAAILKMIPAKLKMESLVIPDGLDPDDFIKQYGPERFESLFGEYTKDGYLFTYEYLKKNKDFKNANDINDFKKSMESFLSKVSIDVRNLYQKIVYDELGIRLGGFVATKEPTKERVVTIKKRENTLYEKTEIHLVIALLKNNSHIPYAKDNFSLYKDIQNNYCIQILQAIYDVYDALMEIDGIKLLSKFTDLEIRKFILTNILENAIYTDNSIIINEEEIKKYKTILQKRSLEAEYEKARKAVLESLTEKEKIKNANLRDELKKKLDSWGK